MTLKNLEELIYMEKIMTSDIDTTLAFIIAAFLSGLMIGSFAVIGSL